MASSDLRTAGRQAYEMARLKRALRFAVYPVPLILLSGACAPPVSTWLAGGLLILFSVFAAWRGGPFEDALGPGLFAGLGAFAVPVLGESLGLCDGHAGVILCLAGGAVTGALLGVRARRQAADRGRFLLAGTAAAVLVGSLGCVLAGLGGLLGMLAGITSVSVPVLLAQRT